MNATLKEMGSENVAVVEPLFKYFLIYMPSSNINSKSLAGTGLLKKYP